MCTQGCKKISKSIWHLRACVAESFGCTNFRRTWIHCVWYSRHLFFPLTQQHRARMGRGKMERNSTACQFILGTVEDKQCTAMHLYLHWYWIFYLSKIFTAPNFCAVTWCRIQASPRKCLRQVWYRCWYYCLLWVQIEKCDINLSWVNRGKVRNELLREIDIYVICHKSFQTMNCRHVNYQS